MNKEKGEVKEEKKEQNIIVRDSAYFSQNKITKYVDELPVIESGPFVVDDSCFVPMSEAIKQLSRISDPTSGQLAQVYDFTDGKDNGKQIPITRIRDFGDLAEYSQEIRKQSEQMNSEILKGQLEAAEKVAFEKELQSVSVSPGTSEKE